MTLRGIVSSGNRYARPAHGGRVLSDLTIADGDFTIVFVPDSQYLTHYRPNLYRIQAAWIAYNRERLNIQAVLHEGDVVNRANLIEQWEAAVDAWSAVQIAQIPYLIAAGNHDYTEPRTPDRLLTYYNTYFGVNVYEAHPWWNGGFYAAGHAENAYLRLSIGGDDYLILCLEFGPRDAVLAWAGGLLDTYADHIGIILTHSYLMTDDTRTGPGDPNNPKLYGLGEDVNDGEDMWLELVKLKANIALVYSGHELWDGAGRKVDTGDNANIVNQVLANYQQASDGSSLNFSAMLRVCVFRPSTRQIFTYTYSPTTESYLTDDQNQYTLTY